MPADAVDCPYDDHVRGHQRTSLDTVDSVRREVRGMLSSLHHKANQSPHAAAEPTVARGPLGCSHHRGCPPRARSRASRVSAAWVRLRFEPDEPRRVPGCMPGPVEVDLRPVGPYCVLRAILAIERPNLK